MMNRLAVLAVAAALCVPAFADHHDKGHEGHGAMDEQMKKAMELSKPGPGHERLEPLVGKWKMESRGWMKPGDKPMESKGTSTFEWVLDGRFLRQEAEGDWQGQKFAGVGHLGYDNVKKRYVQTWMDNMMTGIMKSDGRYDEKTNAVKDEGEFSCPMTGEKDRWYRGEWTLPKAGGDTMTYVMYQKDHGKEFKSMEIVYTRSK